MTEKRKNTLKKWITVLLSLAALLAVIYAFQIPSLVSSAFCAAAEDEYRAGDGGSGRTKLRLAVALSPSDDTLRLRAAQAILAGGNRDEAMEFLESAVQDLPESVCLHQMLISCITEENGPEAALEYIREIPSQDVRSAINNLRPAKVDVYPEEGTYNQPVELQITGKNVYYSLVSKDGVQELQKLSTPLILDDGQYLLRAVSIDENGLVSDFFEGTYTIQKKRQVVYFADTMLENTIRQTAGVTDPVVYTDQLAGVTSLTLYGNFEVTEETAMLSLEDLKWLPNLKELTVTNGIRISDFAPLAGLTNLEKLTINNCGVNNAGLEYIGELRRLRYLNLNYNDITNLTSLYRLNYLETLEIRSNRVESLEPLAGLVNLKSLLAGNNHVQSLKPLAALNQLEVLDLSQNNLKSITPLRSVTGLQSLNVANNALSNLSGIETLTELEELNATGNRISNITAINHLSNLKIIDLSMNNIHNILPLAGLPATELNLSRNNISTALVFNALPKLQKLDIGENNVSDLSAVANLMDLKELNIDYCPVQEVAPLLKLKRLEKLYCAGSGLDREAKRQFSSSVEIIDD